MNLFVKRYLYGLGAILEDGRLGPHTNGRIRTCKYYLGYLKPINATINMDFRQRIWHPKSVRYSSPHRLYRAGRRRVKQRKLAHANDNHANHTTGVGRYDGLPVANAAIRYLEYARKNGWKGRLVSGWRSAAYSESLCYRMCGRPSCQGMCAGRNTNHTGTSVNRFALDVSDYYRFGQIMRGCPYSPKIWNRLPRDRVHYSPSGN